MSDLIERQAAIDALAKHEKSNGHNYTLFVDIVSECAEIIRDLPSAQPEPCGDVVSRKAVEEMLKNGFPARGMWEIEGDVVKQTVCETLVDALMDLEKLPSTDPEFIRCRDCKYRGEYPITDGRYWCALHDTFMYYCSDAKRRTDE